MSSPPPLPTRSSSPPEDEDDEIDQLMRSSPPLSFEDDSSSAFQAPDEVANLGNNSTPPSMSQAGQEVSFQLSGVSRNEEVAMRRMAEKLKLHPYQRNLTQDFLKCSPVSRGGQLMMGIMAIDNKLDQLIAAAPPFSIVQPLRLNIKSFIIAVLLSSKVAAYKGTIPRDHVLALVMRDRLHLPPTFDRDPHAARTLKEYVNHELSQARGKLKKLIKAGNGKNIFDLATVLVSGTSCTVTIPLCGRVALFLTFSKRKMLKVDPGEDFWDTVDAELIKIRKKAGNDPAKVVRYFTAILKTDQQNHTGGSSSAYTIPTTVVSTDAWQLGVDSLIAGDTAA